MNRKVLIINLLLFLFAFNCQMGYTQQLDKNLLNLIKKASNKSRALKINNLEIKKTKYDRKIALNTYLPKVSISSSYTRLNDDIEFNDDLQNLLMGTQKLLIKEALNIPFNTSFPDGVPVSEIPALLDKNVLKASVNMEWVLFSGFKAESAIKATKHQENALLHVNTKEENSIIIKLIDTYDKLGLVIASEKVLESSENYLNDQDKFVHAAIKNGLATPIDRQRVTLAKHQLSVKKVEIANQKKILIELLHRLTDENKLVLNNLNPNIQPISLSFNSANTKRSEILALEEVITASKYKEKMEKSNFIPKVAVIGHYEILEDDLSLLEPKWYMGVGIQWDVFDGNISKNKARKVVATRMIYEEKMKEATELFKVNEVNATYNLENANKKIEMSQQEVQLTKDLYNFIKKQYINGLTSIKQVTDAINDLEEAQFKLQTSFYEQRKASIELLQAKGNLKNIIK